MPLTWPTTVEAPRGAVMASEEKLWISLDPAVVPLDPAATGNTTDSANITKYIGGLEYTADYPTADFQYQSGQTVQINTAVTGQGLNFLLAGDMNVALVKGLRDKAFNPKTTNAQRQISYVYRDSQGIQISGVASVSGNGSPVTDAAQIKAYPIRL